MAGLDQAFIKAYRQQGDIIVAPPAYAQRPLPDNDQSRDATRVLDTSRTIAAAISCAEADESTCTRATVESPAKQTVIADAAALDERPEVHPNDDRHATAVEEIRPAFQVDQFAWADGCTRLGLAAGLQLDRLADSLAAAIEQDRRVIGLASSRRGEGCTTLALCAARRLAERGRRIVLVDADANRPALARALGVSPETGWEDMLSGRLPLDEALIESIHDRLTILPLRRPAMPALFQSGKVQAAMDVLRSQYDLVLVDMGALEGNSLAAAGPWIDGIVVVRDVRATTEAELAVVHDYLAAAELVELGVAENFA